MALIAKDRIILKANTYSVHIPAMIRPAISGPRIREAFMAIEFKPRAKCRLLRGTRSGTMAAYTGHLMANPTPLINVSRRRKIGSSKPNVEETNNRVALIASHTWVKTKKCFRFSMSAHAPLGRPSINTGKFAAV